jgi:hypothetical protein
MANDQNDQEEHALKKRAIFDSMSKRGQERILRIGYENWDPFQEPKDPREQIRGSIAMRADTLMRTFYRSGFWKEEARAFHFELRDLCMGIMRGDLRAQVIYEFCKWYKENAEEGEHTPPNR